MDPPSSSSIPASLHLAMAALVGASLMALSAFYIHKRSVDQVLHRLIEIRRTPSRAAGNRFLDDEVDEEEESELCDDGDDGIDHRVFGSEGGRGLTRNIVLEIWTRVCSGVAGFRLRLRCLMWLLGVVGLMRDTNLVNPWIILVGLVLLRWII